MPVAHRSLLPVLFAALVLLAGCGDDDATTTDTTTTEDEVGETTTTETADGAGGGEDDGGDADGDVTADDLLAAVERTRSADSATVSLSLSFDGGDLLGTQEAGVSGRAAFDSSELDIAAAVNGEANALRFVIVGEDAWVGGDGADIGGALPDGADWATLPTAQLLASEGFDDPGELAFLYLVGGARDVEEITDGYRFDLDLDAAIDAAPAELQQEVASSISFTGSNEPEVTGEVLLDDQGRIERLTVVGVQRPTAEEADQIGVELDFEIRIELEAELTDFDQPLEIEAPTGETVPVAEAPDVAALLGL